MITHHPSQALLQSFAKGELPASLSIAVAAHTEMCSECCQQVEKITQYQAQQVFEVNEEPIVDSFDSELEFMAMIDDITSDESQSAMVEEQLKSVELSYKTITLPRALNSVPLTRWTKLGDVRRARVDLNEEPLRSSLLDISPGTTVPKHSHKGFEVTVVLDGSFSDDMGTYHAGDFIWLDASHNHSPVTRDGCLCYAVLDDAMQFTQGISQLFNPIGRLMY